MKIFQKLKMKFCKHAWIKYPPKEKGLVNMVCECLRCGRKEKGTEFMNVDKTAGTLVIHS